jgi:hypothetical protein
MAAGGARSTIVAQAPPGCPIGPSFTFCSQVPGVTTASQLFQVTLANPTTGLVFTFAAVPGGMASFAPGDFSIQSTTCQTVLNAGDTCAFTIRFSPTANGLRQAALTVKNTTSDTTVLNVEGTGAPIAIQPPPAPAGCVQNNAFTYCDQALNTPSSAQTFTLTAGPAISGLNIGFAAVPGLQSQFNELQPDFIIQSTACGASLGAGASCTVSVVFSPKTVGLRSVALTATDSESDQAAILLAGNTTRNMTIAPPAGFSSTCFPAAGFQFCAEPVGGTSTAKTLLVTNTSGTTLTGVSVPATTTPADFTVLGNSCIPTMPANGSCSLNVAFTPTEPGLRQATLTVTDAQGDVSSANLAGTGDDFGMEIVAGNSQEVSAAQGGTATFLAQLDADGVFGQQGETVSLACPINLPIFSNCSFVPCPIAPKVGGSVPFSIVIVTSSNLVQAPEIQNPCDSPAASAAPGARGPAGVLRVKLAPVTQSPGWRALPAILAALAMLGFAAIWALPVSGRRRAGALYAASVLCAAILLGCGGNKNASSATPVGTYIMNVVASANDSNGNPLNASRGLMITLDVIKGK